MAVSATWQPDLVDLPTDRGDIIWRWVTPAELRSDERQDVALEYAIIQRTEAIGGLVLWAKWSRGWECNPWNSRHVIGKLLEEALAYRRLAAMLAPHADLTESSTSVETPEACLARILGNPL